MGPIDKEKMVIKALFNKRNEYISISEILGLLKEKINENELKLMLDYLIDGGTVVYEYAIVDGTKVNIPLYTLSYAYLKYLENYIKAKTSKQLGIDTEQLNPETQNKETSQSFSEYIIMNDAEKKDKFLKELKKKYLINNSPKDYALMILALKQLSLIDFKKRNQRNVYSALKSFLNNTNIGTDEALNKTIRDIEPKLNDKIEHVKDEALKELTPYTETITNIINNLSKTGLKK